MSLDEIIQMARKAGFSIGQGIGVLRINGYADELQRFAALVAAAERQTRQAAQIENEALKARIARADVELQRAVIAEREACAKVCDEVFAATGRTFDSRACAAAIRARGAA